LKKSEEVFFTNLQHVVSNAKKLLGGGLSLVALTCPINRLAAELQLANSTGQRYTTFNIIMQYTDSTHLTAPPV